MRSYRAKRLNIAFHKIASARGPPVPQIKSDQVIHNANLVGDDTARFHASGVRSTNDHQHQQKIRKKEEKKEEKKRRKTANAIKKQMRFQSESKWPFHDWHTQIIF